MSYTLTLSNGKILVTLPDQQTDSVSTSLTLIGKNVNAYGTDLNDNFVRLLENFSNTTEPTNPLIGQLWFNSIDQRIYVYNVFGTFKPVGAPIVSSTPPANLTSGDLWIDTTAQQLKFTPDGTNVFVAGPMYDASKGKSGWVTDTVIDTNNYSHLITGMWSNGNLVGILSDEAFNFKTPYNSMSSVGAGLTLNASTSTEFNVIGTATNAISLNGFTADQFLKNNTSQTIGASLWINTNTNSLSIGTGEDFQFRVESGVATLRIGGENEDFNLKLNSQNQASVIYIDGATEHMGIFNTNPQYPLDILGNVRIQGNLSIEGTSTYISSVVLQVNNKLIELGYGQTSPSDVFANDGGIVLHGSTDKTLLWNAYSNAWTSSEHMNLSGDKNYKIAGNTVLTGSALGSVITSAPGLTSIGTLNNAIIGQVIISAADIGTVNNVSLRLGTGQTTYVDFTGKKVYNVATPESSDPATSVATKEYVDSRIAPPSSSQFALSLDISNTSTIYLSATDPAIDAQILTYLQYMLPPGDPSPYGIANFSRARVMVTQSVTAAQNNVVSNPLDFGPAALVDKNGVLSSQPVVAYSTVLVSTISIPAKSLKVYRAIKQYVVAGGSWQVLNVTGQPNNVVYSDGSW